jgi:hypothetical protein
MAGKGAPRGNKYAETHSLVTLRNSIRKRTKRSRSFIDLRCASGQNAVAAQAGLIADLGGMEHISTAQKVLVELVGRDLYLLDETDQRIVRVCKQYPDAKKSPKSMATLYSYRQPIANNITKNLAALGLDKKPPPAKTLDEILSEDEQDEQERDEQRR